MCGILCVINKSNVCASSLNKCLTLLTPRGPDCENYKIIKAANNNEIYMGFKRLAIMDTHHSAMQPFVLNNNVVVCNGEIYDYKSHASAHDLKMTTNCDCEIILPLYEKIGIHNMLQQINSEFAMVLYDSIHNCVYAARDRYGVRPLFIGYRNDNQSIGFASELKALHAIMQHVEPVIPGCIYKISLNDNNLTIQIDKYHNYDSLTTIPKYNITNVETIKQLFKTTLMTCVADRLTADRPVGFLLSGGLDSSLIVAIAARILNPENIVCFTIGFENSPDVVAAREVVKYLGIKTHHIVPFNNKIAIETIPNVIKCLESYDITTIRASTPQYKMAQWIRDNTDIRVLLSGEGSDEIFASYKYFRSAPNSQELLAESNKLIRELYMYDCLRTDRTMSGNGLEVRVPFLDYKFVELVKLVDPQLFMYGKDWMEKQLLRDSFVGFLPNHLLYRSKEAFSDAVNTTNVNWFHELQNNLETQITDADLQTAEFTINKPQIKEALYYRKIFASYYPNRDNVIAHYWLPNWQTQSVVDPSAKVLKYTD